MAHTATATAAHKAVGLTTTTRAIGSTGKARTAAAATTTAKEQAKARPKIAKGSLGWLPAHRLLRGLLGRR